VSFFVPKLIPETTCATAKSVNDAIFVVQRALTEVDSNNCDQQGLSLYLGAVVRHGGGYAECPIGVAGALQPATHADTLPYTDAGVWQGLWTGVSWDPTCDGKAVVLGSPTQWVVVPSGICTQEVTTRRSTLHLRFTGMMTSSINGDAGIQFAFAVDGRVVTESAAGGDPSPRDPFTGQHQVDGPVFIRARVPVSEGAHTLSVMYRRVYSRGDAELPTQIQFRLLYREFIISEEG
jgi:hypothetical protein